jgi:hypothetical protein
VLIDHKSFPGPRSAWPEKARDLGGQVQAFAYIVEAAGIPVVGKWLHFPVGAGVVRLV